MAEYIDRKQINLFGFFDAGDYSQAMRCINNMPPANVVEKEMILDFIEDNRPTDVQTDWEKGCAYICDEIERLINQK